MVLLRLLHEVTYFFHLAMLRSHYKPDTVVKSFFNGNFHSLIIACTGWSSHISIQIFFSVLIIIVWSVTPKTFKMKNKCQYFYFLFTFLLLNHSALCEKN